MSGFTDQICHGVSMNIHQVFSTSDLSIKSVYKVPIIIKMIKCAESLELSNACEAA